MLIPLHSGEAIYRQIYAHVRSEILSGRLPSGSRLPSTRSWAIQLNVSRTTLLQAFDQLMAEGYIKGAIGSGTMVCDGISKGSEVGWAPDEHPAERMTGAVLSDYAETLLAEGDKLPSEPPPNYSCGGYDFHHGNHRALDFPHSVWRRLCARHAGRSVPSRGPVAGSLGLREEIGEHLRAMRAVQCTPEQVVILNGSQQGLNLFARLLVNPGDHVVVEEPLYHGARQAFRAAGARLIPCRVDDEGMCVDDLPQGGAPVKLVYVTPSHQFPTGAVLPLARRLALIQWARRRSAYIIEDDYDGELRYDVRPIEAVQALDRTEQVIYLGTVSKALSTELRIGYAVVPHVLLEPLIAAKRCADLFTSTLMQIVLADFFREGHYARHLRRLRHLNRGRRQAFISAVTTHLGDRAVVGGVSAGLHAMIWLPTVPVSELPCLLAKAQQLGVFVGSVSQYYLGPPPRSGVLAGYASLPESAVCEGIRLFAQALRSRW